MFTKLPNNCFHENIDLEKRIDLFPSLNKELQNRTIMDLLFRTDDENIGRVCISRKYSGNKMKNIAFWDADKMGQYFNSLYKSYKDTYVSLNTFKSKRRGQDYLFSLNNLVVDIDCHKFSEHEIDKWVEEITTQMNFIIRDTWIPQPNITHKTGRGIQFIWCINQIPATKINLGKYDFVSQIMIDTIRANFAKNFPSFAYNKIIVDESSRKASGLIRMPYSYNTKAHTETSVVLNHAKELDLYHSYKVLKTTIQNKEHKHYFNPMATENEKIASAAEKRENAIKKLIDMRSHNGIESMNGQRDAILLIICATYSYLNDQDEIMKHVYFINNMFKYPIEENKVRLFMSTCLRKGYKYSNSKIIEILNISEDEQREIGFGFTKKERQKRVQKEIDINLITELVNKGLSKKEIAFKTNISPNKIAEILREHHIQTESEEIKSQILKYLRAGKMVSEISSILSCSKQKVSYWKKQMESGNIKEVEYIDKETRKKNRISKMKETKRLLASKAKSEMQKPVKKKRNITSTITTEDKENGKIINIQTNINNPIQDTQWKDYKKRYALKKIEEIKNRGINVFPQNIKEDIKRNNKLTENSIAIFNNIISAVNIFTKNGFHYKNIDFKNILDIIEAQERSRQKNILIKGFIY